MARKVSASRLHGNEKARSPPFGKMGGCRELLPLAAKFEPFGLGGAGECNGVEWKVWRNAFRGRPAPERGLPAGWRPGGGMTAEDTGGRGSLSNFFSNRFAAVSPGGPIPPFFRPDFFQPFFPTLGVGNRGKSEDNLFPPTETEQQKIPENREKIMGWKTGLEPATF